jgi:hypothetical protein
MRKSVISLFAVGAVAAAASMTYAAPELKVSLGVRETQFAGSTVTTIGANGGATGGIEWINKDAQTLVLDGTWQTFTWNLATDPVAPFAGTSANGILEGTHGVIEHVRFQNPTGFASIVTMWVDFVVNSFDPAGPPPPETHTVQNWEGFANNAEVMFQEPRFSGSTAGDLELLPNFGGVDNAVAFDGLGSARYEYRWLNPDPTPADTWLRLTTFGAGAPNQPGANPVIRLDSNSVVTMRIMGVPEPSTMLLLGIPAMMALARRRRA